MLQLVSICCCVHGAVKEYFFRDSVLCTLHQQHVSQVVMRNSQQHVCWSCRSGCSLRNQRTGCTWATCPRRCPRTSWRLLSGLPPKVRLILKMYTNCSQIQQLGVLLPSHI